MIIPRIENVKEILLGIVCGRNRRIEASREKVLLESIL